MLFRESTFSRRVCAGYVGAVNSVHELLDVSNLTILPPLQSATQMLSLRSATTP